MLFVTFDFTSPLLKRGKDFPRHPVELRDIASTYAPRLEQSLQAAKRPFKRYGAAFLKFDCVHTLPDQAEMWGLLGAVYN